MAGRKCKIVQLLWKTYGSASKKSHIRLPYDPAITLLGMYSKELNVGSLKVFVHSCSQKHY